MEEFLEKYNSFYKRYSDNKNCSGYTQLSLGGNYYNIIGMNRRILYAPKLKENISLKELVCHINKLLLLQPKVYSDNGMVMNIFNIIPDFILESLINDYSSFNTYIHYYILNESDIKQFFEKVVQFKNEKSIYLSLNYIDISVDFNIYKDLVAKISKFENIKLINKTFSKKNAACIIRRVLKNLKIEEIDEFYNSCSKNFIESISRNLYFADILPTNLIKEGSIMSDNETDPVIENRVTPNILTITDSGEKLIKIQDISDKITSNTISYDESKVMIQNIFNEKFKIHVESFSDIKEVLNFLRTYQFLTIDKNLIGESLMEDYIEMLKYIDAKKN